MVDYHVCCGFAGIYAGILNKKGDMWRAKSEVTKECLAASAQYLHENDSYFEFELKDGNKYRLTVIKDTEDKRS